MIIVTHGVIGNTSDFGSAESWFEPRWVNKKSECGSVSEPAHSFSDRLFCCLKMNICLMIIYSLFSS